jgi:hypothetical protein
MGNILQQVQGVWSRITISEATREKARGAWFALLIGSVLIGGAFFVLGPVDTVMTKNLKNQTFGETYFHVRDEVRSVNGAGNVETIRSNGESLAKWLENEGIEFVMTKKNGAGQDVYAVRKATSDLRAAIAEAPSEKHDLGYYAYRIRASASEVPLKSFRANSQTTGSWLFDRTVLFALMGAVIAGFASWLSSVLERKTGFSRSLSMLSGFIPGLIGGGAIGVITGLMTIGTFA